MYRYGLYGLLDPTYILVIIGLVLSLGAQQMVKSTFAKYERVRAYSGMKGAQVASQLLSQAGLHSVHVGHIGGSLTDNYNPKTNTVNLSDSVFASGSVAAISVAAHECGHAIQHATGYTPIKIRSSLVPVANFGAAASWPLIVLGIFLSGNEILMTLGIVMFLAVVAFHLVTLPVEIDASRRGLALLEKSGILYGEENNYAKAVLRAAAMTYVASAASMALQLIRLILITQRYRGRK